MHLSDHYVSCTDLFIHLDNLSDKWTVNTSQLHLEFPGLKLCSLLQMHLVKFHYSILKMLMMICLHVNVIHFDHFLHLLKQLWLWDGDSSLVRMVWIVMTMRIVLMMTTMMKMVFIILVALFHHFLRFAKLKTIFLFDKQKIIQLFCFSKCHDKPWEVIWLFWQA